MITINNLKVAYNKSTVLNNLNLTMDSSCIHGILGLNGSGKTTLLNTLFGLNFFEEGNIFYNSQPLSKTHIAYVETDNYFFSNITGREYLTLFQNKNFDADAWQKLFHLPLDKLIDTYSTGMKKKLAIVGALKLNKEILVLDEPFNGLDVESNQILKMVMRRLVNQGKTILVTSHMVETMLDVCNYIHFLADGKIQKTYTEKDFAELKSEIIDTIESNATDMLNKALKD